MKVPAGIAAVVIAAQSGDHDPLDDTYRAATPVFDVPVLRAVGTVSPDGLYSQGPVPCEFLLYCDGSIGCIPCATDSTAVALEDWANWRYALVSLGIRPPWTREEFEDFYEWLAAMIEEAEAGYADDGMYLLSSSTPTIDYELTSPEPSC